MRRPPPGPGAIRDPRISGLIAGVTNRDARAIYDVRVSALTAALEAGDEAALSRELCEVVYLRLWRARAVAGFDALAAGVLGMDPAHARALAKKAGGDKLAPLPDDVVAIWMRCESTLQALAPGARIIVAPGPEGTPELRMAVPLDEPVRSIEALAELGRRLSSLRKLI